MVNNIEETLTDWWKAEKVDPIKDEVDAFLEKASHPDFDEVRRISDEAAENGMIPKIVHFCFINYKRLDNCFYPMFKTWIDQLKGYTFVNWLPKYIEGIPFTDFCLRVKKYAYYTDYVRVWAMHKFGGVYMDADVVVYKPFDDLLKLPYAFDVEDLPYSRPAEGERGYTIEPAVFLAKPRMKFLECVMSIYQGTDVDELDRMYKENVELCGEPDALFISKLIINNFWRKAISTYGYETFFTPQPILDNIKFFKEHPYTDDTKSILLNDGTNFSAPNTDWPNRLYYALIIQTIELHPSAHAYASHQTVSMHLNRSAYPQYITGFVVPIDDGADEQHLKKLATLIKREMPLAKAILMYSTRVKDMDPYRKIFKGIRTFEYMSEWNSLDELATNEDIYRTAGVFQYVCIYKPDTNLNNLMVFQTLSNTQDFTYTWYGGFENSANVYLRSPLACMSICHQFPNKEKMPDIEYFKLHEDMLKLKTSEFV